MLHVLKPRLDVYGHTLRRSKGVDVCCARNGRRRLSTTAEPSKPGSASDEEPGWPLKYKIAGGAFLGTIIPWMFSYAVANDPGSRRLAGKLSPGLVQWFRNRKGGHFFDEDPKRLEYLAHVPDWIDQPVTIEVRTGSGETRRLMGLHARTPFSSVSGLVHEERSGGGGREGTGARRGWLTDFDVLDEGDSGDGEGEESRLASSPSSWDTSSSSSSFRDNNGSVINDSVRRDVATCNIRSWWDIAALEEQARRPAATTATAAAAAPSSGGAATAGVTSAQKMSAAEQAEAMIEHLDRLMEALEQDKITGARSVDDVEEEVRELRKQRKKLRRQHPGRRRFLGLF
ncbi:unnamed protein product [Pylaiella littoralis]